MNPWSAFADTFFVPSGPRNSLSADAGQSEIRASELDFVYKYI